MAVLNGCSGLAKVEIDLCRAIGRLPEQTINTAATAQMRIMPEDIFGPALPVIAGRELDTRHESRPPSRGAASVGPQRFRGGGCGMVHDKPVGGSAMAVTVSPRKVAVFRPSG